ncbi:hypothetical protein MASR2M44_00260 [Bacteroidota bacterium]
MALKIFWTEEAISSYDRIIDYLSQNWTEKEIEKFTKALVKKTHPIILRKCHIQEFNEEEFQRGLGYQA